MKSDELLNIILDVLGDNVISVVVFGSYVKGSDYDDIDVFILTYKRISDDELGELKKRNKKLHVFNYTLDMLKDMGLLFLYNMSLGYVIYDKNNFMKNVFNKLKQKLSEVNAIVSRRMIIIPKPHTEEEIINYVFTT